MPVEFTLVEDAPGLEVAVTATNVKTPVLGGALLIVWCVFELVYLPNPVSVIYLVIGLVQTACAAVMRPAR